MFRKKKDGQDFAVQLPAWEDKVFSKEVVDLTATKKETSASGVVTMLGIVTNFSCVALMLSITFFQSGVFFFRRKIYLVLE